MNNEYDADQEIDVIKKSIPIYEQETHISWMRDEPFAKIYASDSTQITRLDKLCKESPDMYQLIEDTGYGKRYICKDKSLISLRKTKRQMTESQKEQAAMRMKQMHSKKNK